VAASSWEALFSAVVLWAPATRDVVVVPDGHMRPGVVLVKKDTAAQRAKAASIVGECPSLPFMPQVRDDDDDDERRESGVCYGLPSASFAYSIHHLHHVSTSCIACLSRVAVFTSMVLVTLITLCSRRPSRQLLARAWSLSLPEWPISFPAFANLTRIWTTLGKVRHGDRSRFLSGIDMTPIKKSSGPCSMTPRHPSNSDRALL
jgi:hypothetical protein